MKPFPATIAVASVLAALSACAPEEEQSVENRFLETEAAIENRARALEAETANMAAETERSLANQADAFENRVDAVDVVDGNRAAAGR